MAFYALSRPVYTSPAVLAAALHGVTVASKEQYGGDGRHHGIDVGDQG